MVSAFAFHPRNVQQSAVPVTFATPSKKIYRKSLEHESRGMKMQIEQYLGKMQDRDHGTRLRSEK
jgi:hypothetical protein